MIERNLLKLLEDDARLTTEQIAVMIDAPKEEVDAKLDELEKKIACELHGRYACDNHYIGLSAEQLSVPAPYDRLYWTYLVAMLEFVQGTPETYEFANGVFKEAYGEYARFLQRRGGFGRRRMPR